MKLLAFLPSLILITSLSHAQGTFCNTSGNLVIFTNYDGGFLNINVDQNIPNLVIGITGYEATYVNISGTFASNVTQVVYAGFNATNNHCSSTSSTTITGAPSTATTNIYFAPSSPLSNPNGYSSIICAYSCSTNVSQGGCNTVDQVEAYFLSIFSGSSVYFHKVQYGCWSGTHSLSSGGTCCGTVAPLTLTSTGTNSSCSNTCNGYITTAASGGVQPYTFSGQTTGLCPGNHTILVTDANGANATQVVTIGADQTTPAPSGSPAQVFCQSALVSDLQATGTMIQWFISPGSNTPLNPSSSLLNDSVYYASQTIAGCSSHTRLPVTVTIDTVDTSTYLNNFIIFSNAVGVQYQWIDCNNQNIAIPGATSQDYLATANGSYAVIVTSGTCSDTSACVTVTGVGIDLKEGDNRLKFYPNPVSEKLFVINETDFNNYVITDAVGRIVLTGNLLKGRNEISSRDLPDGIYYLKSDEGSGFSFIIVK